MWAAPVLGEGKKHMRHEVRFIDDNDLPGGVDWTFVVTDEGRVLFFVKRSRICPEVLTESWAAWQDYSSSRTLLTAVNA